MQVFKLSPDEKYFTTLESALNAARESLPGFLAEYRFKGFHNCRKLDFAHAFSAYYWRRKLKTQPKVYVEYHGVYQERWRTRPSGYFCIEPIDVIER